MRKTFCDKSLFVFLNSVTAILAEINPPIKPTARDKNSPDTTGIHPLRLTPPVAASEAPAAAAESAWLSLVGIPKYHAAAASSITVNSEQQSITQPVLWLTFCVPKSSDNDSTTDLPISIEAQAPRKFIAALTETAALGEIALVITEFDSEFGASVKPFMNETTAVSI